MVVITQAGTEVSPGLRRARQAILALQGLGEASPSQFERRLQMRVLGRAKSAMDADRRGAGVQNCAQRAEIGEQFAREVDGGDAAYAGAQKYREQFGVRQRAGAAGKQFFTGSFGTGPLRDSHGYSFTRSPERLK